MATGKSKSKGRSRKFRYDTYMIEVPEDLGDEQERLDQAIIEAYGRARLYVMPAVWTATTTDDPGVVRVVRKRRAPQYAQA